MTKVTVGDPAPDFTLPDHQGNDVTLSGFIGESNVVLYFYPKDFSPGCTAQACHFRDSYEDFTDLGAVVIGVSGDSPESHKRFVEEHLLPFILLSDGDNAVRKLYGATKGLGLLPGRVTLHHRQERRREACLHLRDQHEETHRRGVEYIEKTIRRIITRRLRILGRGEQMISFWSGLSRMLIESNHAIYQCQMKDGTGKT